MNKKQLYIIRWSTNKTHMLNFKIHSLVYWSSFSFVLPPNLHQLDLHPHQVLLITLHPLLHFDLYYSTFKAVFTFPTSCHHSSVSSFPLNLGGIYQNEILVHWNWNNSEDQLVVNIIFLSTVKPVLTEPHLDFKMGLVYQGLIYT